MHVEPQSCTAVVRVNIGTLPKHHSILVTGATGLVGRALLPELHRRFPECSLRVLTRQPDGLQSIEGAPVDAFGWDPGAERIDAACMDGVKFVVHLAGEPVAQRWTEVARQRIRDSRIRSIRLLQSAAARSSAKPRIISASAIGCYPAGDAIRTEQDSCGEGFLAEVVRDWEDAVRAFGSLGGGHTLLRIGLVLSKHGGVLKRLIPLYRLGLGAPLGAGLQWQSWVHIDDLVAMFVRAIAGDDFEGAFNAVSPHPIPQREFSRALASAMHRPHFLPPIPTWALRLWFGEAAEALMASHRVVPERLEDVGFTFTYPHLEGALSSALR